MWCIFQAAKLVGQFTPEKVKMQQAVVKEAVEKEVIEKGLGHAEANKLLKTTLLVSKIIHGFQ